MVVYIGDSITAGAGITDAGAYPTAISDDALQATGFDAMRSSNQGHSGFTTVDFLPGADTFAKVEQAADEFKKTQGILVFSIMLGTNDSAIQGTNGAPVSKEKYYQNLKEIVDRLLKDYPGCKIVIHHPLWYSPNTYNGAKYLQEGLDRLQSYFPQIDKLVESYDQTAKGRVFLGDTDGFEYFKKNHQTCLQPENGHQGTFYLHPNDTGAKALGQFWAKAIRTAVVTR
jgi:lysophospholipase L1-like esterase